MTALERGTSILFCSPYMFRHISSRNWLHDFPTHSLCFTFSLYQVSVSYTGSKLGRMTTRDNTPLLILFNAVTDFLLVQVTKSQAALQTKTLSVATELRVILLSQRAGRSIMTPISSPKHVPTRVPSPSVNRKERSVLGFYPEAATHPEQESSLETPICGNF